MISVPKDSPDWDNGLIKKHSGQIVETYGNAVAAGYVDPLIVGYDLSDEFSYNVAVEHFGADEVEAACDKPVPKGSLLAIALSRDVWTEKLSRVPGFYQAEELVSDGVIPVLIITGKIANWLGIDKPTTGD